RRVWQAGPGGGAADLSLADRSELLDIGYLAARVFGVGRLTEDRLIAMRRLTHVRLPAGGPRLTRWADIEALVREVRGDDPAAAPLPVRRSDVRRLLDLVTAAKSARSGALVHRQVVVADLR